MKSSYSIHIDFDKTSTERPERVFEAMALFVQGFNEIQAELLKGYGEEISFESALVSTREGSLIADMSRIVKDSARGLKLRSLLDALYFSFEEAITKVEKIDSEGDVNRFINKVYQNEQAKTECYENFTCEPDANPYKVAKGIKKIYEGKSKLLEQESVHIGVNNNFKLVSEKFDFPRPVDELFVGKVERCPSKDVLVVRRPVYIGDSKWDFISAISSKQISAEILDEEWLEKWKNHKKRLLPGDALEVEMTIKSTISAVNKSRRYEYYIDKVKDIVPHTEVIQYRLEI